MYREKRAISLVILTLFVYASTIYFESNSFVLPFPIFDFILIILAIQFAIWNWKDFYTFRKWYFFVYFFTLISKLLMNPILWGILLDEIKMENFLSENYLEFFKLAYTVLSLTVFISWSLVEKLKKKILWVGIISLVQLSGMFELSYAGMYFGYALFSIYVLYQKPRNSLSYMLPLHGILDLMTLSILIFKT
jgi:hypothetical protein